MNDIFYTANLMGGLGNQMFQIAHAISQSWKYGYDCYFKPIAYTPMQANQPTKYINNIFRNIKFLDFKTPYITVNESHWNYANLNFNPKQNIEFNGYFQSSKNFLGFDEKIKKLFEPTVEFIEKIKLIYPEIFNKNSISIHVRRGDYLTISEVLPVLDISYFLNCLSKFNDIDNVYVFSDDKNWIKNNFSQYKLTIVDGLEDYEEMWAMSLCSNNIISNSSFSWWASFLNKNENKKIFSPNVWFGPKGPNPYDSIFCKNFNLINVKFKNNKLVYEEF
jgi:hypothetical protein